MESHEAGWVSMMMDRLHTLEKEVLNQKRLVHPDFELIEDPAQCYLRVNVFWECNLDSLRRFGIALIELIGKRSTQA